jgi:hypothetical protein
MANAQEAWRQLQRMAVKARAGGGGGGGPSPRGVGAGVGGLILLGGAAFVANNALFNVDGGHRAIKYTRVGGVGKEIYSEGNNSLSDTPLNRENSDTFHRNPFQNPMVRNRNRLRCSSKAT